MKDKKSKGKRGKVCSYEEINGWTILVHTFEFDFLTETIYQTKVWYMKDEEPKSIWRENGDD